MPFLDDDLGLTGFQPIGHPDNFKSTPDAPEPPANPAGLTEWRLWGAAFERENEIGALGPVLEHRRQQFGDPDPDHNPWTSIVDTDLQPHWEYFLTSRNQKETDYLIARVRREMENTKILDEAGWKGFLASGVASIASPSTLLSGPGLAMRGARGLRLAEETLRKGARVGVEAAGGAAIQEAALHQMQATRTMNESLLAVGGATVLGSLLGAGIAQYKGRSIARLGERMEADLRMPVDPAMDPLGTGGMQAAERLRAERLADVTTRIDGEPETGSGMGTSVGAKAVEIAENKVAGTAGLGEALSATSPLTRVAYSSLGSARDALHRLVESPLALKQNEQGIPTGPRGGSVETMIKTQGEARLYRAVTALDQAFGEYRFGTKDATAAPLRAGVKRMMGDRSALTFKEFKEEVGRAMRAGDVHDNKFVAQAAKAMRKELFDPLKAMAQKYGLLPEDAMLPENYLTRVYDVDTILRQYPRFINTLVDYLKRGQAGAERAAAELEVKIAELEKKAEAGKVAKKKSGDDGDDGPDGGGGDPQPEPPLAPKSPEAVREEFAARTEDRIEDYRDKIDDINIALKAAEGEEKAALQKELDDAKARVKDTEEELAKSVAARTDLDDAAPGSSTKDTGGDPFFKLAQLDAAIDDAITEMRGILPEGVGVRVFDDPDELGPRLAADVRNAPGKVDAFFDPQTAAVYLARHAADPAGRMTHETVHALRSMKLLTDKEVELLAKTAADKGDVFPQKLQATYGEAYANRPDPAKAIEEEAAAHLVEARKNGTDFGREINGILDRVLRFFERLRNKLNGYGFQTADDVIEAVLSGEMAKRKIVRDAMVQEDITAFALRKNAIPPVQGPDVFDWNPSTTAGSRETKIGNTTITYGVDPKRNYADLILVETPRGNRGEGSARTALERFLGEADRQGRIVTLTADPMDKGVSKGRLEKFYRSLGFVPNKGKNVDFTVRAGMVRQPQPTGSAPMFAFAGERAKTADLDKLSKAKTLEGEGADRTRIWKETGWFRGVDQKWRFEIDDSGAVLRRRGDTFEPQWRALADKQDRYPEMQDILRHEQLRSAYPSLARKDVKLLPSAGDDAHYLSGNFGVNKALPRDEVKPALLHEGQHAIQELEGFGQSGKYQTLTDDQYRRIASEVEARTVEKRMNMTPEERAKRPPWEDYDVAEKDQIVRMPEDQGPMFAMTHDIETGQSMRRDLDALGYYSKALEAARDLKQAKGTPEQMLAMLKKAGVKDAEIEATGLNKLFEERSGSTTALESDAITLPPKRLEQEDFNAVANLVTTAPRDVGPYELVAAHTGGYVNYDLVKKGETSAYDANGDSISQGSFKVKAGQNGGIEVTNARVADEAMQKKGIGTRVYDLIQKDFGDIPLMPSPWNQLSPNAVAFWAKRDRKKLEWTRQQQVESYEGDRYPGRIIPQQQGDRTASPPRRASLNQVTKSEIIKHLEENRVGLSEVVRDRDQTGPTTRAEIDAAAQRLAEDNGLNWSDMGSYEREDYRSEVSRNDRTKWSPHSLDPSNPTYRETVLHLPSLKDRFDANDPVHRAAHAIYKSLGDRSRAVKSLRSEVEQFPRDPDTAPKRETLAVLESDRTLPVFRADGFVGPGNDVQNFDSGHFPEPNIVGHMMTSMTRHEGKPVFLIDQIQSDWGQKLRDGGARDEAKIAELKRQVAEQKAILDQHKGVQIGSDYWRIAVHAVASGVHLKTPDELARAGASVKAALEKIKALGGADHIQRMTSAADKERLLTAELRTAEAGAPGNPLVNTTDQWTTTTLRRAIRQAIEADADYIAIPHGDTVLSYNPGDTNGMRGFYGSRATEGIVPKNLRKLLQSIDKEAQPQKVETLTTPAGERGYKPGADSEFEPSQTGFTLFPLTPAVKDTVRVEGLPMFALRQESAPELPPAVQPVANEIRRGIAQLPRAVRNAIERSELDQAQVFQTLATTALRTTARKGTVHAEDMADIKALGLLTDDEWRAMSKRAEKLRPIYRTDAAHQARFEAKFGPDATEQVEEALTREAMAQMMREGRAGSSFSADIDGAMARTWGLLEQVGYRLRQSGIRTDEQLASTLRPAPQTAAAPVPQIDPAAATGELQGILGPYLDALRTIAPERGLPDFSMVMDEAGRVAGATDTAPNIKFTRDTDGTLSGVEYQGQAYSIDRDAMGNIQGLMTAAQKAVATQEAEVRVAASRALEGLGLPEAQARAVADQAIDLLKASPDMAEQIQDVVARALSGDGPRFALADAEKGGDGPSEKPKKPKTPKQEINELKKQLAELRDFADKSDYELKQIAQDAASKITGSPAGRVIDPHFLMTGGIDPVRQFGGPLQKRTMGIPDQDIMDFIDHDVERLARYYTRSVAPDVALVREFGDLELSETKMKIQDEANALKRRVLQDAKMSEAEFARLGEAATEARKLLRTGRSAEVTPDMKAAIAKIEGLEAEHLAIQKMADRDMRDLQAMSDRLRHAYALPENASGRIPRLARMVKSINYLRLMGGMTISAIPDLARHVMVNGIGNNLDGMVQALANFKAARKSMEEVKLAGTALDMVLDSRALGIADMMDNFGAHSKFERGIETLQGNYGIVSLMAPWNAAAKQWAGFIVQTNILRAARDVSDGKALSKGMTTRIAKSGLDHEILKKIWAEFMQHGEIEGKVMIANTDDWTDDIARNAYRGAIVGDVDRIIVTPGQEKPLWMSTQTGSIIGQFKSFGLVSVQRVTLAAIQQRDAGVYVGAMMAVALGVAVEYLKALAFDKQLPKSIEQLIYAGVGNSGLTGWLYDADHLMYRASRGTIGAQRLVGAKEPISRYKSQNVSSALAGPSAGALQDILQAFGGAASGDIRQSDVRAMRRLIPYQNLFYLGKIIRNVEDQLIEQFDLPKMKPRVGGALG